MSWAGTTGDAINATRVSSDQRLEQDFNSLDAQREACAAYIKSQAPEGWKAVSRSYDDGGFSGGSLERPAVKKLLKDIETRKVDVIVVYKIDRLTRSLADFAKLVELFDKRGVSFISVRPGRWRREELKSNFLQCSPARLIISP